MRTDSVIIVSPLSVQDCSFYACTVGFQVSEGLVQS